MSQIKLLILFPKPALLVGFTISENGNYIFAQAKSNAVILDLSLSLTPYPSSNSSKSYLYIILPICIITSLHSYDPHHAP